MVMYRRTPLIRINWDDEPSGYAENPDNWIFKWVTLGVSGTKKIPGNAVLGYVSIYVQIKH